MYAKAAESAQCADSELAGFGASYAWDEVFPRREGFTFAPCLLEFHTKRAAKDNLYFWVRYERNSRHESRSFIQGSLLSSS